MPRPRRPKRISLAELLRSSREAAGLSIRQLDEASGVDKGLISRLESGTTLNPKRSTLNNLAAALDIDAAELHQAAGYLDNALPGPVVYFRNKYGDLPDEAADEFERYVDELQQRFAPAAPRSSRRTQPSSSRSQHGRRKP